MRRQILATCTGFILSVAACASDSASSTEPVTPPAFTIDERVVGDSTAGYFSLEISPDMRFMVWQEVILGAPGPLWSCGIDPLTGDLIPQDGRGFRVDNVPTTAAPQWGVDAAGVFYVTLNTAGQFLIVRPSSALVATVDTLATVPNATRAYPYPTRIASQPGAWIAFLQNDAQGRPQIHVLNTQTPNTIRALTSGPVDFNTGGGVSAPSFVVTVFRWLPGTTQLSWGFNDSAQRLQLRGVDVAIPGATIAALTDEPHDHVDAFPAILRGEAVLVGGINSTAEGALYTRATSAAPFRIARTLTQPSALAMPMMAASYEPFEWNGGRYATYIVLDGGRKPSEFPAEVWLTDLDTGTPRRLSSAARLNRLDPEYFLGTNEVFVFHYARPTAGSGFRLYRARTGLRR